MLPKRLFIIIAGMLAFSLAFSAPQRMVKSLRKPGAAAPVKGNYHTINERLDTLRYENPELIHEGNINFWQVPNRWRDDSLCVRFTPLYAPFYLIAMQVMFIDTAGNDEAGTGSPGMQTLIWQSSEEGIPGQLMMILDIPYEELHFAWFQSLIWNTVDLRPLEISFNDTLDFHIGVTAIANNERDRLALVLDDGDYTEVTRSYMWDGADSSWLNFADVQIPNAAPYNFAIHAIISPDPWGVGDILTPSAAPSAFLLEPAYPNPFNAETRLYYQAPLGSPFTVSLWDASGRQIRQLRQASEGGAGFVELNAEGLRSGYYFVRLESLKGSKCRKVIFIK